MAELLEHGLLRGSFVPPPAIRELRDLTRYRKRLIQAHTSECQRIEKTLEDAGIKLDSVASEVLGVSGRAMLAALITGERDPQVLAELAKGRLRKKIPALRQALRAAQRPSRRADRVVPGPHLPPRGDDRPARRTGRCGVRHPGQRHRRRRDPFGRARDRLDTITGVGKRAAECIITEIGVDMSRFPTAAHLAPLGRGRAGQQLPGGKRGSGKEHQGRRLVVDILTQCAWAAAHTRDTYLSSQFWRLARRIGKRKAAVAVAHSILVICWHLLATDCDYDDPGGDYFTRRNTDRQRDRLIKQLHDLGYRVTLDKAA